jgi:hypothetical protein
MGLKELMDCDSVYLQKISAITTAEAAESLIAQLHSQSKTSYVETRKSKKVNMKTKF